MQNVDEARLDKLRFRHGGGHPQDWLAAEEQGAFRHGVNLATEAEAGEIIDQARAERPARAGGPVFDTAQNHRGAFAL